METYLHKKLKDMPLPQHMEVGLSTSMPLQQQHTDLIVQQNATTNTTACSLTTMLKRAV